MFEYLSTMSFNQAAWFSVAVYALHYAEEGPRLVDWFNRYLPTKLVYYTQKKLNLENALLSGGLLAVVIFLNIYPDNWLFQAIIVGSGAGFICNTIFHVIPTLKTGIYSPGVISSSMINPIFLLFIIWKASQSGILTWPLFLVGSFIGLVSLPVSIFFTHFIIFRKDHPPAR
jgi:hypothetical protein